VKYLVVFEKSRNGYGAYAPDLPGLGVVGRTLAETRKLIQQGIEIYVEELRNSGGAVPKPSASAMEYEVVTPALHQGKSPTSSTPSKRTQTKRTPERAAAHG
jgi:predicted RNase H-like HicB family nuclease